EEERCQEEARLHEVVSIPSYTRPCGPEHQQRGNEEIAHGIAEPPSQPDGWGVGPTGKAAYSKTRHTKCGTHRRAHHAGKHREFKDILRPLAEVTTGREPIHQVSAYQCFERVACCDPN